MKVQNKGGKGNPYHDDASGEFASSDVGTRNEEEVKSIESGSFHEDFMDFANSFHEDFMDFVNTFEEKPLDDYYSYIMKKCSNPTAAKILNRDLKKLGKEEALKIKKIMDCVSYMKLVNENGHCRGTQIFLTISSYDPLCNKLGFEGDIRCFAHESGHAYYDKKNIGYRDDVLEAAKKSRDELIVNLAKEGGYEGEIDTSSTYMTHHDSQVRMAVWKGLEKMLFGEKVKYPVPEDFGVVINPGDLWQNRFFKENYTLEEYVEMRMNEQYNSSWKDRLDDPSVKDYYDFYNKQYQTLFPEYKEKMKAYQEAEESGMNQINMANYHKALDRYEEYNERVRFGRRKYSLITDFLGCATDGAYDVRNEGYFGHKPSYTSGNPFGRGPDTTAPNEFWAEFVAAKILKLNDVLEVVKKIMPTLYNKYEEIYNEI